MGLVQREIEAAGFSTVTLSNIPDLTAAVSVPRIAAIERPFGRTIGEPGDRKGQRAVLRAALRALETIQTPGGIEHLPFEYEEPPEDPGGSQAPPPIVGYIIKHPWQLPRLLNRNPP